MPVPVVAVAPPVPVPVPAGPPGLPVAPAPRPVVRPATPPVYYFPTAVGARWVYEERADGKPVGEYTEVVTRVEHVGAGAVVTVGRVGEDGTAAPVARVVVADRRLELLSGEGAGRVVSIVMDRVDLVTDLGDRSDIPALVGRLNQEREAAAAAAAARAQAIRDRFDPRARADRLHNDPGVVAWAGRAERVTVPGGVFTAVPVTVAPRGGDPMHLVIQYEGRVWYAPGVGMVRRTVGSDEVVLKSFTPGRM
ncbi:hypothetical protein J0H58_36230 [bacterium]|nr:hypothetical protein [bacterium]